MRALASSLAFVVACGGAPNPAAAPPPTPPGPVVTAPASRAPLFVEVVAIRIPWVAKTMPLELETWKDAPAQSFRHILIKGKGDPAAKKKAQALLDRIKKGEDFDKLARESSEDPREHADEKVRDFAEPVRDAYAKLKVGEVAPALVPSDDGFHVIKKSKPSEELVARAYRDAMAPVLAKRLARELAARLKDGAPARAAIADAVVAVLGETASADEKRPKPIVVEREHLARSRLPADVKAGLTRFADGAKPGDVLAQPIAVEQGPSEEPTVFVARAATQ
ncbi:MAG: peptidylprolyl isomerase [Labilithrix sp.]|nr:peptidylprolyl isomerase [Labilithrix sp.]MCW5815653.1 peptidylprolyl isomerase [Labilithrix sp.]